MKRIAAIGALAALCSVSFGASSAGSAELIYTPKNPGFGGNPLNEDYLLGLAQIQNQHIPSSGGGGGGGSFPDINFPPIVIGFPNTAGTGLSDGGTSGSN